MDSLVSTNTNQITTYFSTTDTGAKSDIVNQISVFENYVIPFASGDYVIEKVIPTIKIEKETIDKNFVSIEVTVDADIYWNAANALGEPILGNISEKHVLNLVKESNVWKIDLDVFDFSSRRSSNIILENKLNDLINEINELRQKSKTLLEKAKRSKPSKLELIKKNEIKDEQMISPMSATQNSYNRAASTYYAELYWKNYNSAYKDMSSSGGGGDCTNFISQCIKNGGANFDNIGSYKWAYDNKGTSSTSDDTWVWTWGSAYGLNYAVIGNYNQNEYGPKAYAITIKGDSNYNNSWGQYIDYGDFIQYSTGDSNSTIYHSALVTGFVWNSAKGRSEPTITQHSSSQRNIPWTKSAYKTYFMFMTGINNDPS